jgi:hypothetical protein
MDDFDDPTESLHEKITEAAREQTEEHWSTWVAITTAMIAVVAAIAGMFAGHHSNEALVDQVKASDSWAYYQAKSIKAEIIENSSLPTKDTARMKRLKQEQQELQNIAKEEENSSKAHLDKHVKLSRAVTLFQVAIAISAIAIVSRKRFLWLLSIVIAVVGIAFLFANL